MWRVDPLSGTEYRATGSLGQDTLFGSGAHFDAKDLLASLRKHFGTDWFTIEKAVEVTLVETPYRKGHLRKDTLEPAIRAGQLDVVRASERGLTAGSKLRFRE